MVTINYSSREVCCKIVYYGPGLSGKTTNLQYVHEKVPGNTRGELISLATEADRTLYFDFLPINIGTINGFAAKFQLYTVPGQVYYNATRKLVLRGVDGIVFVADSQADKIDENIESLSNLEENLREYGYDCDELPVVIQYNKRDMPNIMSIEELQAKLNTRNRPFFEAAAPSGKGVFDTLKYVIKLVLDKAKASGSQTMVHAKKPAAPKPVVAETPASVNSSAATDPVAVQTAVEPKAESEPEKRIPAYRPYPGSTSGGIEPRKLPPTSFAPVAQQGDESPIDSRVVETDDADGKPIVNGGSPQMAPSRCRRELRKKRGFFKRLFGKK